MNQIQETESLIGFKTGQVAYRGACLAREPVSCLLILILPSCLKYSPEKVCPEKPVQF